jgi:hypothetical protein
MGYIKGLTKQQTAKRGLKDTEKIGAINNGMNETMEDKAKAEGAVKTTLYHRRYRTPPNHPLNPPQGGIKEISEGPVSPKERV